MIVVEVDEHHQVVDHVLAHGAAIQEINRDVLGAKVMIAFDQLAIVEIVPVTDPIVEPIVGKRIKYHLLQCHNLQHHKCGAIITCH